MESFCRIEDFSFKIFAGGVFNAWERGNATKYFSFWFVESDKTDKSDSDFRLNRHIRQNRLLDKRLFRLDNPHHLNKLFPLVYLNSHHGKTNIGSYQQKQKTTHLLLQVCRFSSIQRISQPNARRSDTRGSFQRDRLKPYPPRNRRCRIPQPPDGFLKINRTI